MAKKRKRRRGALGGSRRVHAKRSRSAYNYAMKNFKDAIKQARSGDCAKALDNYAIGRQDFGDFLTEFKHAVGYHPSGAMAAPRMKSLLNSAAGEAHHALRRCLRK